VLSLDRSLARSVDRSLDRSLDRRDGSPGSHCSKHSPAAVSTERQAERRIVA
jgi:hypothetical protein